MKDIEEAIQDAEYETIKEYEMALKEKDREIFELQWQLIEQKDKYKNEIDELKEENEKLKFDNVFARKLVEEYKDRIVDGLNYDGYKEKYEELLEKTQSAASTSKIKRIINLLKNKIRR